MRAHISINVRNVQTSVDFYHRVFGVLPQKQTSTYAKFDLEHPPLNFAMLSSAGPISGVNHFGIEVDSPEEVKRWEKRLAEQGVIDSVENEVTCCYAVQDKVWVTDPDGNKWEVFTVLHQLPVTEGKNQKSQGAEACCV